jgi:hypothetical protein
MWGLPHFLDSQLTHGCEVVSLMHQQPFTPRKIPGTHFSWRLSRPHGHNAAGRIKSIEKFNDLIQNRTHDLLACSIVPQPNKLSCASYINLINKINFYTYFSYSVKMKASILVAV